MKNTYVVGVGNHRPRMRNLKFNLAFALSRDASSLSLSLSVCIALNLTLRGKSKGARIFVFSKLWAKLTAWFTLTCTYVLYPANGGFEPETQCAVHESAVIQLCPHRAPLLSLFPRGIRD